MKKKSLLIICLSILALLFSIGGALWFTPINLIPSTQKPNRVSDYTLEIYGTPTLSTSISYYAGEENISPTDVAVMYKDGNNQTSVNGSWALEQVNTSSTSASITAESVKITFTADSLAPDGLPFLPVATTISTTLSAVAKFGSNYYTTIDGALAAANSSSGTVYSLPLGYAEDTKAKHAKTIETTTEIKSGVTLCLPYEGTNYKDTYEDIYKNSSGTPLAAPKVLPFTNEETYLQNTITIGKGHTLKNRGIIQIGGVIAGSGASMPYASFTATKLLFSRFSSTSF